MKIEKLQELWEHAKKVEGSLYVRLNAYCAASLVTAVGHEYILHLNSDSLEIPSLPLSYEVAWVEGPSGLGIPLKESKESANPASTSFAKPKEPTTELKDTSDKLHYRYLLSDGKEIYLTNSYYPSLAHASLGEGLTLSDKVNIKQYGEGIYPASL